MERYERQLVALPGGTSDVLLLNKLNGISYSRLIDQSIAVGCSFYDMDGCRYLSNNMPWRPPTPVEYFGKAEDVGKNYFEVDIFTSQLRRWEALAGKLKVSMPAALDWCIRCWSDIQTQRLLERTIVCIRPNGERETANFGILD